jgi:hypothetical protein
MMQKGAGTNVSKMSATQQNMMKRTAATFNEASITVANVEDAGVFSEDNKSKTSRPYQPSNMHMSNIPGAGNDPFSDECADLFERDDHTPDETVTRFSADGHRAQVAFQDGQATA